MPSPPKSIMSHLDKHMVDTEAELKGAKEDLMIEHSEIILYSILNQIAEKAAEQEVISVLAQNIDEERAMADWIMQNTTSLVTQLWPSVEAPVSSGKQTEVETSPK
jgi:ferritin-like metal-binding protein YciE